MAELQVINYILQSKSLDFVNRYNITEDYFTLYKDEFKFILEHYRKYSTVPDKETMATEFKDFEFINVGESEKYMAEKLQEAYIYAYIVPVIQESANILQTDSIEAVDFLNSKINGIKKLTMTKMGQDITKRANESWEDYLSRREVDGLIGITSGFKEIDDVTHGWLPGEDVIAIVGRPNEGKSWIAQKFGANAWERGYSVLHYSGEMSTTYVTLRQHTLVGNFSNNGLQKGSMQLGSETDNRTPEEYKAFLQRLQESPVPYWVVTPEDFGGRPTMSQINMLIEMYKPDLVIIDQLSLMEDERASRGQPTRVTYGHLTEDMLASSIKYKIPFIVDCQGSRKSSQKNKNKVSEDNVPELDEIAEADAIGQNVTRMIGLKQTSAGLKLGFRKNRYGINNKDFLYYWDIDVGTFRYIISGDKTEAGGIDGGRNFDAGDYESGEEVF